MTALIVLEVFLFLTLAIMAVWLFRSLRSGKFMEYLTAFCLARLNNRHFRVYNNILLPDSEGGSTQVDHLVVCSGGIYCVETKGWGGKVGAERCYVSASPGCAQWKVFYKGKHGRPKGEAFVPNPLRQNYKHHLCLSRALNIPPEAIYPMVVLPGFCRLCRGVTIEGVYIGSLSLYRAIRRQAHGKTFSSEQICAILRQLDSYKAQTTRQATHAHKARLKEKFSGDVCPRCGRPLVERRNRQGKGHPFLGCSGYPRCHYTRPLP